MPGPPQASTLFPYTTLFRSCRASPRHPCGRSRARGRRPSRERPRSEEHTSELQSRVDLVCRLLLEKKKQLVLCPLCKPPLPCEHTCVRHLCRQELCIHPLGG